jgi:Flp pilus assembly protein TadD
MLNHPAPSKHPLGFRLPGWLLAVLLVAATVLAYQPVWRAGFIWDDDAYLTKEGLRSLHGLGLIWSRFGATPQYYPLTYSAFWLEHRLWGDASAPYHWVIILLHASSALLVAVILKRLEVPGAWMAAALFALHPVQVESVAWVSEIKNTLSGLFYLGAMLAYLKFQSSNHKSFYGLGLLLFVLGLLTKTVVATLPGALLVLIWWKRGRLGWRRDVLPLVPFFAAGLAAGVITARMERVFVGAHGAQYDFTFLERCLIAGRDIWFYLGKLCWPVDLMFMYPRWHVSQGALWQYAFPLGVLAVVAVLVWRRWRGPLAALLFFVGTLFPALGFFNVYPFRYSFVADHFQYLACLGPLALAASALCAAKSFLKPVLCGALILTFGIMTWHQAGIYTDAETLWQATLRRNPDCWAACDNLAVIYSKRGWFDQALLKFQEAIRLNPDETQVRNNLATTLASNGRTDDAIKEFRESIRLNPYYPDPRNNLGVALVKKGLDDEAIVQFETAIQLKQDYPQAHFNLAMALERKGQINEAIQQYREAIRQNPRNWMAMRFLGSVLENKGQLDEAISLFRRAVELKPNDAQACFSLGGALDRTGRMVEAIARYQDAIRLKPDYVQAHNNLGTLFQRMGRLDEAIGQYRQTLLLKPDVAETHYNLGLVLNTKGRLDDAINEYREAVRLNPDFFQARKDLGDALETMGRLDEAMAQYREALRLKPDDADTLNKLDRASKRIR